MNEHQLFCGIKIISNDTHYHFHLHFNYCNVTSIRLRSILHCNTNLRLTWLRFLIRKSRTKLNANLSLIIFKHLIGKEIRKVSLESFFAVLVLWIYFESRIGIHQSVNWIMVFGGYFLCSHRISIWFPHQK